VSISEVEFSLTQGFDGASDLHDARVPSGSVRRRRPSRGSRESWSARKLVASSRPSSARSSPVPGSCSLGPTREGLIRKTLCYSPRWGEIDFTVPMFDEFMKRWIPDLRALR
jgi:hypothetical protein